MLLWWSLLVFVTGLVKLYDFCGGIESGHTFKTHAQKLWPMASVYLASRKAPRFL